MRKSEKNILRLVAAAVAFIVLVIGTYEAVKYYSKWNAENEKVRALVAAARVKNASGDYESAWRILEDAFAIRPESKEVKAERVNTAMPWLRNLRKRNPWKEEKYSDVTDKLIPVLIEKATNSNGREKADALAHIGWANYLKFKDGIRNINVENNFREALKADSTNVYANAMRGFWMLFHGSNSANIIEAKKHFEAAKQDRREEKYLREMKLSSYRNSSGDLQADIIEAVNEMRILGDTIPFADRNRIVTDVYYTAEEMLDIILSRLSPDEQLQTFLYLTRGINAGERLYLQFINALLLEKLEDYHGAYLIYKTIASKKSFPEFKYKYEVGDGIRRLSEHR